MRSTFATVAVLSVLSVLLTACARPDADRAREDSAVSGDSAAADTARLVATVSGFTGPEAVRYDPAQDIYFVSNWGTGPTGAKDNNGFISRMTADGTVDSLRFVAGGMRGATLHSPRGMTIVGDTLWVVDVDAVRGFNRSTGAPLATIDFTLFTLGFLNDIAAGTDGLYVTDTGTDHIYRITRGAVTVALRDSLLGNPNGITRDSAGGRFIIVPWEGDSTIRAWTPGERTLTRIAHASATNMDGVELLSGGRMIVAAQSDSSLHLVTGSSIRPLVRTGGEPADIAVDTRRNRVAVPFVARNLVEIWQLPGR